jgi:hypothetical protein
VLKDGPYAAVVAGPDVAPARRMMDELETTLVGAGDQRGGQMSQQAPDLPRSVQIIGRYRTLVGLMAVLGLLAGAVLAALTPLVFTSKVVVLAGGPACPGGAICGGPLFSSGAIQLRSPGALPSGVQIKLLTGDVVSVSASAGTAARAEAAADAALDSYLAHFGMSAPTSMSYPGEQASARLLESTTAATGTAAPQRLFRDALLGAVFGALLGIIAALAAGRTTIDPLAAPRGLGVGEEDGAVVQETEYAPTGMWLEQLALEHVAQKAARESALGRSEAEPPPWSTG